jgi:hypothetical protein
VIDGLRPDDARSAARPRERVGQPGRPTSPNDARAARAIRTVGVPSPPGESTLPSSSRRPSAPPPSAPRGRAAERLAAPGMYAPLESALAAVRASTRERSRARVSAKTSDAPAVRRARRMLRSGAFSLSPGPCAEELLPPTGVQEHRHVRRPGRSRAISLPLTWSHCVQSNRRRDNAITQAALPQRKETDCHYRSRGRHQKWHRPVGLGPAGTELRTRRRPGDGLGVSARCADSARASPSRSG